MSKILHLQGIRGIAILFVIGFHYYPKKFQNGYIGVDMFFVLSGYLMTQMMSKYGEISCLNIFDFLYRRMKRILPLYYLFTLAAISTISFIRCQYIVHNLDPADRAILLTTNVDVNEMVDYFELTGWFANMFTHTWSLCLELQFYLIFPILWLILGRFEERRQVQFLQTIGLISLFYYLSLPEIQAFNSMFARIWQFSIGIVIFLLQEKPPKNEKYFLVEGLNQPKFGAEISYLFLSVLLYSILSSASLSPNLLRMTTTLCTAFVIYYGHDNAILQNKLLVFIGEISYSWYLIHWPLLMQQKMELWVGDYCIVLGLLISFFIAILVHFFIEKPYLQINNKIIILFGISLLILANYGLNKHLSEKRMTECLIQPPIINHFNNMALDQIKEYNFKLAENDWFQQIDKRCIFASSPSKLQVEGYCKYKNENPKNNKTILLLGNSWTTNSAPIIFEECHEFVGNIHRLSYPGCEVLTEHESHYCQKAEEEYLKMVERLQPDYLFIINRFIHSKKIQKYSDWERYQEVAQTRLARLSKAVKTKIYHLKTFPLIWMNQNSLDLALEKREHFDWKDKDEDLEKVQRQFDKSYGKCEKCAAIDYKEQFVFNGTFYPYDPVHFVTFMTYSQHFSLTGLERIRPIYAEICKNF